ncbi:riboflavin kinase [Nocardioides bruguierae]|uniref:riboflavin kinase n=1 Tax=Nocardioides bruguierae TaxID=2945102 RepID=A0A9X2D4Z7_9ACTN|nr:riboflavin kinase [Nocardioides bruguierae]MCL8024841.1 riboflavin kinase [Nocardioides bruguierae]MCM0619246.1 riboflavin kinase [Nocardioides bruguierae]
MTTLAAPVELSAPAFPSAVHGPLVGVVERGDQRGRELGFPTANVGVPLDGVRDGVWTATVVIACGTEQRVCVAAVSVGRRPTYYRRHGERLLEAHLVDFDGDLYGSRVVVRLHRLLRGQRRFKGSAELVAQMTADVESTRAWAVEAGLGDLLTQAPAHPPRHVRATRGRGASGTVTAARAGRARQRIVAIAQALGDLGPERADHESIARATGIPLPYLRWAYPSLADLHAVRGD